MTLLINLQSIKCLNETNELSASDEVYVLVSVANMRPTAPGLPAVPDLQVFSFGIFEDMDDDDEHPVTVNGQPFWGTNGTPQPIQNPADVAIVVSLMEQDNGSPNQYRNLVSIRGAASLTASLGDPDPRNRAARLTSDIGSVLNGIDLPIPFALDDDHLGTQELRLEGADLIDFGVRDRRMIIEGDGGTYELIFRITFVGTLRDVPGVKGIASLARIPGSMEIWWTSPSGSIEVGFWYDGGRWNRYRLAPDGSAAPGTAIAAVSRIPQSMEEWWIGPAGSVEANFWYEGGQPTRYQLAPNGSAAPDGGIVAVSRIPNSMEVWWIGPNGSIEVAFWYEGGQWTRYQLSPDGSAAVGGTIATLSRIPNSLELWWIGPHGSVEANFWYEGGQPTRYQLAPNGSAAINGGIAAVSRIPGSMEVWWTGPNGSMEAAFWYEGGLWTRYQLAPDGSAATNGGIAAVSRIPSSMELWWVDGGGRISAAFWYEGGQWTRY
ncbi:hypothetical protein NKJ70_03560 [Mesorhizobium sp. M0092]|uniref:hypothetical protein n=1 Tax=unclassified Mesorhizobium TaxID=325217 RepID=UPI003335ADA0